MKDVLGKITAAIGVGIEFLSQQQLSLLITLPFSFSPPSSIYDGDRQTNRHKHTNKQTRIDVRHKTQDLNITSLSMGRED